jgi:hypothetical protein
MFGVETDSFLPNEQSDRRNLARQGEPRHRRFHSSGNLELEPAQGMLILDIVDGVIVHVEILNRNDIRGKLLEALP